MRLKNQQPSMSSIALNDFDLFQRRVSRVTESVHFAKKVSRYLSWFAFLHLIPNLCSLISIQRKVNAALAFGPSAGSPAELKTTAERLHGKVAELHEDLAETGMPSMRPYSRLLESIDDENAYLKSIIDGYRLALSSDFRNIVRSTVEGLRGAPEPLDCPTHVR